MTKTLVDKASARIAVGASTVTLLLWWGDRPVFGFTMW